MILVGSAATVKETGPHCAQPRNTKFGGPFKRANTAKHNFRRHAGNVRCWDHLIYVSSTENSCCNTYLHTWTCYLDPYSPIIDSIDWTCTTHTEHAFAFPTLKLGVSSKLAGGRQICHRLQHTHFSPWPENQPCLVSKDRKSLSPHLRRGKRFVSGYGRARAGRHGQNELAEACRALEVKRYWTEKCLEVMFRPSIRRVPRPQGQFAS